MAIVAGRNDYIRRNERQVNGSPAKNKKNDKKVLLVLEIAAESRLLIKKCRQGIVFTVGLI